MATIRVRIGDMPPLLRSLVEGILEDNRQFELVDGDCRGTVAGNLPADHDVLVISESVMERVLSRTSVLAESTEFGVLAISYDGQDAAVMRLNSHRRKLGAEPPCSLARAIIDAAGLSAESG